MAERYFVKFPVINYSNTAVINIMERAVVYNTPKNTPNFYYPFDVVQGQRPDQIADHYYSDQYISWMMYLTNGIIDPYYQWYLSAADFNNYITSKYNTSIPVLQNSVMFYRNNWYNSPGTISVSNYNALDPNLYKFYEPYYDNQGNIISYFRSKIDWTINTNSIINYSANGVYANGAPSFMEGEIVTINFNANYIGKGQVVTSNSTSVLINNVSGTLYPNSTVIITGSSYLFGNASLTNVAFTAVTSVANNIPAIEASYWDPVYTYDYENELNEANKSINLVNKNLALPISKQLTKILNG